MSKNKILYRGPRHRNRNLNITQHHIDAILDALKVAQCSFNKWHKHKPTLHRRQYTVALHRLELLVYAWREKKEKNKSKKLKKSKTIATFDRKTGKLVLNKGADEIALWRDLFRDLQNTGFKNENNK